MFCIECGKEEKLYNNLCESCFRRKTKLAKIPKKIKISKCPHCLAIKYQKNWISEDSVEDNLKDFVKFNKEAKETKIIIDKKNSDEKEIKLMIYGKINGLDFFEKHSTEFIIKSNSCDICNKKFGNYYEAIIQFRANGRDLTKIEVRKAREIVYNNISILKDREAFISKERKVRGGIDFYISTTSTANILVNYLLKEFGGKHSKSPKLVGRKDGREVYRITYLVRIPKYCIGDFISFEKEIYRICKINRKNIITKDMKGEKFIFKPKNFENSKVLGNEEILKDALVISQSDKEVQILDPDSYKTVDVLKPKAIDFKVGETVKILKFKDDVFIYLEF